MSLKRLPSYAKTLLLMGASTTGNFTDGYYFVEEHIKTKHADVLLEFSKWIDLNIGGAGIKNIDLLFASFTNPDDVELTNMANEVAKKIQQIKSRMKTL